MIAVKPGCLFSYFEIKDSSFMKVRGFTAQNENIVTFTSMAIVKSLLSEQQAGGWTDTKNEFSF